MKKLSLNTKNYASMLALALMALQLCAVVASAQQAGRANGQDARFSQGDELVQIDFKDVELTVVIETIARITGKNFIYDDRVRGRVTIVSPSEVSVDQAFAVFESVLKIKGFTAIPGPGGALKIVPIRDAKESSIQTVQGNRPSPNRDMFVTRLVPLLYIDAEDITNTIKPLVSKDASMVAYAPTNTIILTDTEANIRRLMSILDAIDVETHKEELAVIKIKYADAATLGDQISEIYGAEVSSTGTSANSRNSRRRSTRRTSSSSSQKPTSLAPGAKSKVRIMTDDRTNSLLVLASRSALDDIRELVKQLDVPLVGGGRIHVYYLKHADAEELSNTLSTMLSGRGGSSTGGPGRTGNAGNVAQNLRSQVTELAEGITLSADAATNSLVIQASKEAYEILIDVIRKLDIERPQVLVEALIMTVDVTDNMELGMDWAVQVANADQQWAFGTASRAAAAASGASGINEVVGFLQQGFTVDASGNASNDGTNIQAILSAEAQNGNVNIVSAPHILTSDNEEAEIKIGDNIPIITSRVDSANGNAAGLASSVNVERQDIGVTLRVTPQISEGDTLRLKIFQQIEQIATSIQASVGDPESVGVALTNRQVENTVVVSDGDTVVIGGLISDKEEDKVRKVPYLGDIPILGWAFKTKTRNLRKINLMIFLTPHIIRSEEDLEYETIRQRENFQEDLDENYDLDDATVDDLEPSKTDNPVAKALREHAEKYPLRRKEELDAESLRQKKEEAKKQEEAQAQKATRYMIRAKVYSEESKAAEALTQIIDAGYEGSLVSGQSGGNLIYELFVGPYTNLSRAKSTSRALSETYGFSPSIVIVESPKAPDSGTDGESAGSQPEW